MSVKFHEAFSLDSARRRFFFDDHFLGDSLRDLWALNGVGSAAVVDAQDGGIVKLTTGAIINNTYQISWGTLRSLHINKNVTMETRVKTSSTTEITVYLMLWYDWDNFIMLEKDNSNNNWRLWCEDGAINAPVTAGVNLDTNYHIYRIECHTHGSNHVHFYIDGVETSNSPVSTNLPDDAADYLQPLIYVHTGEDVAKSIDVDYVVVRQDR